MLGETKFLQIELGKERWVWRQIKATSVLSALREEEEKAGVKILGLVV